MTNLSEYAQWSPIHKKTQQAETKKKVGTKTKIAVCKIALWFATAGAWAAMAVQPNMPWLIKAPLLATALLLFDRAVWMMCLTLGKSAVTDAPDAHSFERTSLFLTLLVWLMPISYKQFGDGECDSKPYAAVIVEKGKEVTIDINKDNTLGICDFIQNNATSTLMWALCTVPLLLLFGAGWKTLKATRKSDKKEVVWLPFLGIIDLLCCIAPSLKWLFSRIGPILIKLIVTIVVLLATFVLHCLLWSGDLLKQLRSRFQ